jgi:hypothetical protein
MKMKPGFYPKMTMEEYQSHKEAYSRSLLVEFAKSPAHCKAAVDKNDEVKQDKFELGTAAHSAILEGWDAYYERLAVVPNNVLGKNGVRSTKAYKEWAAKHAHKTILLEEQVELVRGMYAAIQRKSTTRKCLMGGIAEVSVFWEERVIPGHVLRCRCRPDHLPGKAVVVDLKTTGLPLSDWPRYAANSKAHWSAYWTCRGLEALTGKPHHEYLFVVVETKPPHDCMVFRTPEKLFELASHELTDLLPSLAYCDQQGFWLGSPDEIVDLEYPRWVFKDMQD